MAELKIVEYPSRILREKSKEIEKIDDEIVKLVEDMIDTMRANNGLGLSAVQVGKPVRLFIVEWGDKENPDAKVFINPVLFDLEEKFVMENEGCLSLPGVRENVERFYRAKVEAMDIDGKVFRVEAEGILAVALQHEYDHLEGKLFIDRLTPVKRNFLLKKYRKMRREKK